MASDSNEDIDSSCSTIILPLLSERGCAGTGCGGTSLTSISSFLFPRIGISHPAVSTLTLPFSRSLLVTPERTELRRLRSLWYDSRRFSFPLYSGSGNSRPWPTYVPRASSTIVVSLDPFLRRLRRRCFLYSDRPVAQIFVSVKLCDGEVN